MSVISGSQPRQIKFGKFEIDTVRRRLLKDGEQVALNSRTFDLLLALVEHHTEVLSKDELLDMVWEGQFVEEGNLKVHISTLRKVFGEKRGEHRFIVTVPGRGYSFVAELEDLEAEKDDQVVIETHDLSRIIIEDEIEEQTSDDLRITNGNGSAVRGRWAAAIAMSVLVIGFGAYFLFKTLAARAAYFPFKQTSIKRLTSNGNVVAATISADGKLFVYSVREGDEESLWLGHVDGSEPVEIRPAAHILYLNLKFDPDGSSIYYTAGENFNNGALFKMPVLGGPPQKLREGLRELTFARDGKQIAYVNESDEGASLLTAIADGSNERPVATMSKDIGTDWHSDAWSPDGSMISLAATTSVDESKAFVVNVSDGSVRSLSDHGWRSIRAMSWLYDGSGVIVVAVEKGFILPQLWLISYPGGDVHRLTTDLSLYGLTTSALNDDSILSVAGMNQSNIWLASASDLADAKQITFGSPGQNAGWNGVAFTPDGRIVYSSENNEGMTLWIMEADGRGQKQIIPTGGINNYPSVTADGRYVVFQSNRSGHFAVWRADLDGGNMVQLTGDTPAGRPFVSSDGRAIVYTANGDGPGELWKMSIDGSGAARLLDAGADWAQISPDGQMIACEYQNGGSPKLAILPIDGSRQPTLFDVPRLANFRLGVHWSPDGRSVTYRDWADGLWEQSVSGGEPHRIAGLPKEKLFSYAWSADGRMLAFTRGSEVRDVVLIRDSK